MRREAIYTLITMYAEALQEKLDHGDGTYSSLLIDCRYLLGHVTA